MKSISILPADALTQLGQARNAWHCWVPNTTRSEDVAKSAYWVHHMHRLHAGDIFDLVTRDGLLDMTVRIVNVANGLAKVNILRAFEDAEARAPMFAALDAQTDADDARPGGALAAEIAPKVPQGYKVGFHPTEKNYYVMHKVTGSKLRVGFATREQALEYARQHAKASGLEIEDAA